MLRQNVAARPRARDLAREIRSLTGGAFGSSAPGTSGKAGRAVNQMSSHKGQNAAERD